MTTARRDGDGNPMSEWIRNHRMLDSSPDKAALSIHDLDFVVHKYVVRDPHKNKVARQHLMLIEAKTFGGSVSMAQRDTLSVLHRLLKYGDKTVQSTMRGKVKVFYHGIHLLWCSGACPDTSDDIRWDHKPINRLELVQLIRFELNAYTLKVRDDRLHHERHAILPGFNRYVNAT